MRKLHGPKRRLEIGAEYGRLIATGIGTAAACKPLGIGGKTGYRWRAKHGGVPSLYLPEADRHDRYLSLLERQRIAPMRTQKLGIREIGRAPSTVSRELRRNTSTVRAIADQLGHKRISITQDTSFGQHQASPKAAGALGAITEDDESSDSSGT